MKELVAVNGTICALAALTAATPELIIRSLTGVLFTKTEAAKLMKLAESQAWMFGEILGELIAAPPRS